MARIATRPLRQLADAADRLDITRAGDPLPEQGSSEVRVATRAFNRMQKRIYEMARRHQKVNYFLKVIAPWSIELEIMVDDYAQYNEVINQIRREFSDVLTNVESTNMGETFLYPAPKTIFDE